jgi:phosphohistidine phosphatase
MANLIKEMGIMPDIIISSTAVRALTTAKIFAETLNYKKEILDTGELYDADEDEILDVIKDTPDENSTVFVFGHNPGLTDFVNSLSGQSIANVPTCGIAGIELDIDSWRNAEFGKGILKLYEYPKKYIKE